MISFTARTNSVTAKLRCAVLPIAFVLLVPTLLHAADNPPAEPLRFRTAIDLALQHSGVMGIAAANQLHSRKAYEEVKNHYLPQLTAGSGLGYSVGFPLTLEGSAPSVFNFTSTQSLFNLSLRQFLKAAKIDWNASSFDVQDKRAEVILDTALSYAQLVNLSGKLNTLTEARKSAEKAQFVTEQRLNEGVDSKLDLTKAQLTTARIRLRIADAQGQQDVLREHLAKLTGLTPAEIQPDPESMPQLPLISQEDDLAARAATNSPLVKLAEQKADAAAARAKGDLNLDPQTLAEINALLIQSERKLTRDAGQPTRPWYKHMIYAPGAYTGYAVKTIPAVREAIEESKWQDADQGAVIVGQVLMSEASLVDSIAQELEQAEGPPPAKPAAQEPSAQVSQPKQQSGK